MKKLLITAALASTCILASAQDMMSKRGTPILPEAGDWSIGVDGTDMIRYFGNLFTKDANNNSSLSPQVNQTLVGLYVKDENTAFRLKLRIGFGSQSTDNIVHATGNTSADATVNDNRKMSNMNFTIGGGIQKWRGKGRLHGIYGAELGVGIGSSKSVYAYGNDFNATTIGAGGPESTTDFDAGISSMTLSRTTEDKNGSTFNFGIDAFIGAEYFFAPKMSLSGEYAWGLGLSSTGEGEMITE
ncbi:MAG: hypothetical protein ABI763_12055, partial [Bacteroidota bacterium]